MKLQEGETVLHELHPGPGVMVIWFFTKCFMAAGCSAGACLAICWCLSTFLEPAASPPNCPEIPVGLVALVVATVYCSSLRKTYVYYVTDQRCVFHGGILRRVERSVPYHKITDVETSQNLFEKALGVSTLNIFTPGTGSKSAEVSFVGLKDPETPAHTIAEMVDKCKLTRE